MAAVQAESQAIYSASDPTSCQHSEKQNEDLDYHPARWAEALGCWWSWGQDGVDALGPWWQHLYQGRLTAITNNPQISSIDTETYFSFMLKYICGSSGEGVIFFMWSFRDLGSFTLWQWHFLRPWSPLLGTFASSRERRERARVWMILWVFLFQGIDLKWHTSLLLIFQCP